MKILKLFWKHWKIFAFKFGEFMSGVILTLFYFFIITPHAVLVKVFSDPLEIKKKNKKSGWHARKSNTSTLKSASKQY